MDNELNVGGVKSRDHIINLGAYWKDVRYDCVNGCVIYKGCHYLSDADESDKNWTIWNYSYEDGNLVREQGPLTGSWNARSSLDWDCYSIPPVSVLGYDNDMRDLLDVSHNIFIELKKISMQLNIITDNYISEEDLEK